MISSSNINEVSKHVATRSQTMTVERLEPTKFRVTPSEPGRPVRIVEIFLDGPEGRGSIDCYAEGSLVSCPANIHGQHCSHSESALKLFLEETS